jgi:hypothetical protein
LGCCGEEKILGRNGGREKESQFYQEIAVGPSLVLE